MKQFYLDLAKICFGIGFYGCVTKIDDPTMIFAIGMVSLLLAVSFFYAALSYKGD